MIRVKLSGNLARDAKRWLDQLEADAAKAVEVTAAECAADIRAHTPVESGDLQASVRSGSDGLAAWAIAGGGDETPGEVGWNEFGTSKMAAQPFVRPAADRAEATFKRNLRSIR